MLAPSDRERGTGVLLQWRSAAVRWAQPTIEKQDQIRLLVLTAAEAGGGSGAHPREQTKFDLRSPGEMILKFASRQLL
jgi:hypothetical protein